MTESQIDYADKLEREDREIMEAQAREEATEGENELWDAGSEARYKEERRQMARADSQKRRPWTDDDWAHHRAKMKPVDLAPLRDPGVQAKVDHHERLEALAEERRAAAALERERAAGWLGLPSMTRALEQRAADAALGTAEHADLPMAEALKRERAAERGSEACCYCGRPGRSGECYTGPMEGRAPFDSERCPSCGFPWTGLLHHPGEDRVPLELPQLGPAPWDEQEPEDVVRRRIERGRGAAADALTRTAGREVDLAGRPYPWGFWRCFGALAKDANS